MLQATDKNGKFAVAKWRNPSILLYNRACLISPRKPMGRQMLQASHPRRSA